MIADEDILPGELTIELTPQLEGRTLTTRIRMTQDLRQFFFTASLNIWYEDDIHADEGLLCIPGLALLLPLAWLTGADIKVPSLDRSFAHSAANIQSEFQRIYPKMPFGTRLMVDDVVDSAPNPAGKAMLFSGGLDATYTFYEKRFEKPRLIQIFGTEFPLSDTRYQALIRRETTDFAQRNQVEVSFIRTDFFYLLDPRAVTHRFFPLRERLNGDLWKGLGYPLGFLGISAPLSAGRFQHLSLAAWANQEHARRMRENPDASSPTVDEKIAWSNLRVEHHGCLHRHEKVRQMAEWLPGQRLRVCWMADDAQETEGAMNCSQCEKCVRTLMALVLNNVDPAECGFQVEASGLKELKSDLIKGKIPKTQLAFWWGPLQREIPEVIDGEAFGLRKFMEWLRDFDLGDGLDVENFWTIQNLYSKAPYWLALRIRQFVFGIIGEPYLQWHEPYRKEWDAAEHES
jgi:hypothetical protein